MNVKNHKAEAAVINNKQNKILHPFHKLFLESDSHGMHLSGLLPSARLKNVVPSYPPAPGTGRFNIATLMMLHLASKPISTETYRKQSPISLHPPLALNDFCYAMYIVEQE